MQDPEFEAYVQRLEAHARRSPGGYRLRAVLFGALGYVYVFGVLVLSAIATVGAVVLLVTLHAGALVLKILIPAAAFLGAVGKSLWVHFDRPPGEPVTRPSAPRLFDAIDEIAAAVRAPRVHRVYLDDRVNAAVVQTPRLGIFGFPRNDLYLGLPLLHAVTEPEARAILAHELGHLSAEHGRSSAWVYRIRQTWSRIEHELSGSRGRRGLVLFEPFFRWYAPRFNAYSFVLARAHEFVADREAAQVAGAEATASGLARLAVASTLEAQAFWTETWTRSREEPEPPRDAFETLAAQLATATSREEAPAWLQAELDRDTDTTDTHPCLRDRLAALGVDADPERLLPRTPAVPSAAEALLGDARNRYLAALSRRWADEADREWTVKHREFAGASARLQALTAKAEAEGALADGEVAELAWRTLDVHGRDAALPRFREAVERDPANAETRLALGQLLLGAGEEEGLGHVTAAMDGHRPYVPAACQAAFSYLLERGREQEANGFRARFIAFQAEQKTANLERSTAALAKGDTFAPHGLDARALHDVRMAVARQERVARAYLVRKQCRTLPERPLYVLALVLKTRFGVPQDEATRIVHEVLADVKPLGDRIVLTTAGKNAWAKKTFKLVPGAEIFVRGTFYPPPPAA